MTRDMLLITSYALLATGVIGSLWLVQSLNPTSTATLLALSAWLTAPYLGLATFVIRRRNDYRAIAASTGMAALLVAGGAAFVWDVVYAHPDPQGAIAILMLPLFQAAVMGVLMPLALWLAGKSGR